MNRGEPSDDPSKIRGEILSSGDPLTRFIVIPLAALGISYRSDRGDGDSCYDP